MADPRWNQFGLRHVFVVVSTVAAMLSLGQLLPSDALSLAFIGLPILAIFVLSSSILGFWMDSSQHVFAYYVGVYHLLLALPISATVNLLFDNSWIILLVLLISTAIASVGALARSHVSAIILVIVDGLALLSLAMVVANVVYLRLTNSAPPASGETFDLPVAMVRWKHYLHWYAARSYLFSSSFTRSRLERFIRLPHAAKPRPLRTVNSHGVAIEWWPVRVAR